jgi:predicted nucleic acid-binding protein
VITAIDTNVLLDVLAADPEFCAASAQALEQASDAGSLTICDLVYAELCVHFAKQRECDEFLESVQIRVEPLNREAQFLASRAWRTYRKQGGPRTRILPDFLIGAHAQTQATLLLTRDRGFYRKLFPALALIDPKHTRSR